MTSTTNAYCAALGIPVPRIEDARSSPDANYYSLLLVALLERGEPLTLEEAACRFEEAGVAPASAALGSLKRCKPARPPIYRDGNRYALDPHDDEADLWAFRSASDRHASNRFTLCDQIPVHCEPPTNG